MFVRSRVPGGARSSLSVLVVDGECSFAPAVVRCLHAVPGVAVHVLSSQRHAPVRYSWRLASYTRWAGLRDAGAPVALADLARRVGVDLCLAAGEDGIRFLSGLEQPCAVVGPSPVRETFECTTDKWLFAERLRRAGLPHPDTRSCPADPSEDSIAPAMFPALLKPRRGSNGAGIRRVASRAELSTVLGSGLNASEYIVQSEIPGHDIDCSVLCHDGVVLAHTIQRGLSSKAGYRPASGIEFVDDADVRQVVWRLMRELRWTGVAHVDLRWDERTGRVSIIELNPRYWGSLLGSLHAGVNFPYLACLSALGRPFLAPTQRACRYVSGGATLASWGPRSSSDERVPLRDTVFRYALADPWPSVVELLARRV